jgi:hypothetical protein
MNKLKNHWNWIKYTSYTYYVSRTDVLHPYKELEMKRSIHEMCKSYHAWSKKHWYWGKFSQKNSLTYYAHSCSDLTLFSSMYLTMVPHLILVKILGLSHLCRCHFYIIDNTSCTIHNGTWVDESILLHVWQLSMKFFYSIFTLVMNKIEANGISVN